MSRLLRTRLLGPNPQQIFGFRWDFRKTAQTSCAEHIFCDESVPLVYQKAGTDSVSWLALGVRARRTVVTPPLRSDTETVPSVTHTHPVEKQYGRNRATNVEAAARFLP
jgi:hypothetical protein